MRGLSLTSRSLARGLFAASLAIIVTTLSSTSSAQVNAEALRSTLKKNPTFLWLEGALVGRVGNTETMSFAGSAADYGHARGETTVARWTAHARYNYRLRNPIAIEALAQVQHDRFRRLAVRDLYGAGLRFELEGADDLEVFAGTTYLFEHEVLESIPGSPTANDIWHRSSNYAGANLHVAPLVDVSTVTYLQPRFDRPLDFRVLSDSYVSFKITSILSARISASVWYDNRPPAGVRSYDVEIKNSLVVKLP
ncbi:MAG: DUF481 domain-containing protein [Myxococcales bacterium]|nr:DUF481 domain-containing protein [Myxococcales bacterium]